MATPVDVTQTRDNVFEMAASTIRFGPGATAEVGMDLAGMGAKRVCLVTDENVGKLESIRVAQEAMAREGVEFVVFDGVRVEPKDYSWVLPRFGSGRSRLIVCTGSRLQLTMHDRAVLMRISRLVSPIFPLLPFFSCNKGLN